MQRPADPPAHISSRIDSEDAGLIVRSFVALTRGYWLGQQAKF